MEVKIQSVKFDADAKLLQFVQSKMDKLERFIDRATSSDVIMKLDKDHDKGNKVTTITVNIPGDQLVAEARAKSFEETIDQAVDALKHQIERVKSK